jgi:hypothetical protein
MSSESPSRRASDHASLSAPRVTRPVTEPEPGRTEKSPETAGHAPDLNYFSVGNGRANGSRERRHRTIEWHGPERRVGGRF